MAKGRVNNVRIGPPQFAVPEGCRVVRATLIKKGVTVYYDCPDKSERRERTGGLIRFPLVGKVGPYQHKTIRGIRMIQSPSVAVHKAGSSIDFPEAPVSTACWFDQGSDLLNCETLPTRKLPSWYTKKKRSAPWQIPQLADVGSLGARKGMVPRSRALPAVDLYEEPRPAPRRGLKLCECGLPVAPGLDMCRRCALLDYGTTSARIIGPGTRPRRQKIHRGAAKRAAIIDILRDRPEGATITEMLQEMGQDPGAHTPRNSLQIFLDRWVPETEGRVIKRPCTRKGQRATCYHLDTGFSRRRRQR